MGRFQLESIYLYFPPSLLSSTPTRPVDNVVIATKGLQDRNTNIIAGTTVENKGKLILNDVLYFRVHYNLINNIIPVCATVLLR